MIAHLVIGSSGDRVIGIGTRFQITRSPDHRITRFQRY